MSGRVERTSWADLKSDKALVCHREINGEQGGATVWSVMAGDGFLIECGKSEERARHLADLINEAGPERLGHESLKRTYEPKEPA